MVWYLIYFLINIKCNIIAVVKECNEFKLRNDETIKNKKVVCYIVDKIETG
jgi:hypothetical protein